MPWEKSFTICNFLHWIQYLPLPSLRVVTYPSTLMATYYRQVTTSKSRFLAVKIRNRDVLIYYRMLTSCVCKGKVLSKTVLWRTTWRKIPWALTTTCSSYRQTSTNKDKGRASFSAAMFPLDYIMNLISYSRKLFILIRLLFQQNSKLIFTNHYDTSVKNQKQRIVFLCFDLELT